MKKFYIGIFFVALVSSSNILHSQDKEPRWDIKMIKEAPIWKNLLVNCGMADYAEVWPERKAALKLIVEKYPESQWADDAELFLAGGKASFENNIEGAIADLKDIAKRYPNSKTILCNWTKSDGFLINSSWLFWAPGLVSMETDSLFPFDKDGRISILENEALVYFDHMEKYPTHTNDLAQYTIALMLLAQDDINGAIAQLENFISKTSDLATIKNADYAASVGSDGYLIGNEFPNDMHPIWRVQYSAYIALAGLYQENGNYEKADALMQKIINNCASDGWLWRLNYAVASSARNTANNDLVNNQLNFCEKGIKKQANLQAIRMEVLNLHGYMIKDTTMTWQEQALKKYEPILQKIEKEKK